ncbi:GPP34 family phosphoprotein [Streptomyces sp. ATexAB-D23]|uniref:GOLPH3/VPS74 family protein n=1 Tax=unclassified Streptomyces TaxID=2593676 RepID=UPI0003A291CC|nr:GPP34 family phosphoprotein [Streptomyces sp. ATexAB-D23]MYY04761.1 GPP34 family phosphoprotein [Streptomyces sp. SID4913]
MFVQHFTLPEELLLLAYDPVEGRALCRPHLLRLGLAGALAAELVLAGRVAVDNDRIIALGAPPVGDALLDAALTGLAKRRKGQKLPRWIRDTAAVKTIDGRSDEVWRHRLIARGALHEERSRALGIVAQRRHPAGPDDRTSPARERVTAVVNGASGDGRDQLLAAFAGATGLADALLPGDERHRLRGELALVARRDPIARTVRDLVNEARGPAPRPRGGAEPLAEGTGWNPLSWIFNGDGGSDGGDGGGGD